MKIVLICCVQSKNDDDRISIANDFIKATEYEVPLLIDLVSDGNRFNKVYSSREV